MSVTSNIIAEIMLDINVNDFLQGLPGILSILNILILSYIINIF